MKNVDVKFCVQCLHKHNQVRPKVVANFASLSLPSTRGYLMSIVQCSRTKVLFTNRDS